MMKNEDSYSYVCISRLVYLQSPVVPARLTTRLQGDQTFYGTSHWPVSSAHSVRYHVGTYKCVTQLCYCFLSLVCGRGVNVKTATAMETQLHQVFQIRARRLQVLLQDADSRMCCGFDQKAYLCSIHPWWGDTTPITVGTWSRIYCAWIPAFLLHYLLLVDNMEPANTLL